MISRAVVCPGAPLLIPGLADGLRAQLSQLVDACDQVAADLRGVDRVLLLTSRCRAPDGGRRVRQVPVVHPPGTSVTSAVFTGSSAPAHFTGRLPGAAGVTAAADPGPTDRPSATGPHHDAAPPAGVGVVVGAAPPAGVGVVVGAALLARAGIDVPVTAVELADPAAQVPAPGVPAAEVTDVLERARTSRDQVGLLVVADGSAYAGVESPGGGSSYVDRIDMALAAALRDGHPRDLYRAATFARSAPARRVFGSGPALLALAELTARRPPQRSELLLDQAPLGVAYLVARWSWD